MERENNQLERAIQETEGKVLRAQMNPHFVFNALNSIRALITEDPSKAKKESTNSPNCSAAPCSPSEKRPSPSQRN